MPEIKEFGRVTGEGRIHLLSGLHIGAGKDSVEIGGTDSPVIKHPHTGQPYIPGSSIKGRIRFLLEWALNRVREDGKPWGAEGNNPHNTNQTFEADDPILRTFGNALKSEHWQGGPTRLIVRDAPLVQDWVQKTLAAGLPLTEEKTEVVIDRIQGKALEGVGPRTIERVPASAEFEFNFSFRLYSVDKDDAKGDIACLNWWLAGLGLLEQDALGGSGSRGYGRVRFENLTLHYNGRDYPLDGRFRINRLESTAPSIWEPD
jgi:CRISPR-associated protein Csm3